MKLRNFLSAPTAGSEISEAVSEEMSVSTEKAKYKLLQQMKSLMPGQTIQGKIVGKENAQVQIQLASDLTLSARLDTEIPIETGKIMTFQVKNNGKGLTLSPLFANLTADENVIKALDMAGIPASDRAVAMTESMMKEGMSIDRQSLQTMFKQISAFPEASVETIVQLQKLSVPITAENLEQAENYQALNHQIEKGLQALLEEFDGVVQNGYEQGNITETNHLVQAVIEAVFGQAEGPEAGKADSLQQEMQTETTGTALGEKAEILQEKAASGKEEITAAQSQSETVAGAGKDRVQELLKQLLNLPEERENVGNAAGKLHRQLAKELVSLLGREFQEQFRLKPEQVREGKPVQELYEKIQKQLSDLTEAVSRTAGKETTFFKSVNQMQNNLDFMNQLNQTVHFVQLPLRLNERNAHGDLYVYTNKKNLAQKEGSISAFLHLDMEYLGSVDIYVTMEEHRVGTRFQVQDDEMLSFLYSHMHILDERLQKRGYTLSYDMKVREEEAPAGVLDTMLSQDRTVSMLSQHAFDVRA